MPSTRRPMDLAQHDNADQTTYSRWTVYGSLQKGADQSYGQGCGPGEHRARLPSTQAEKAPKERQVLKKSPTFNGGSFVARNISAPLLQVPPTKNPTPTPASATRQRPLVGATFAPVLAPAAAAAPAPTLIPLPAASPARPRKASSTVPLWLHRPLAKPSRATLRSSLLEPEAEQAEEQGSSSSSSSCSPSIRNRNSQAMDIETKESLRTPVRAKAIETASSTSTISSTLIGVIMEEERADADANANANAYHPESSPSESPSTSSRLAPGPRLSTCPSSSSAASTLSIIDGVFSGIWKEDFRPTSFSRRSTSKSPSLMTIQSSASSSRSSWSPPASISSTSVDAGVNAGAGAVAIAGAGVGAVRSSRSVLFEEVPSNIYADEDKTPPADPKRRSDRTSRQSSGFDAHKIQAICIDYDYTQAVDFFTDRPASPTPDTHDAIQPALHPRPTMLARRESTASIDSFASWQRISGIPDAASRTPMGRQRRKLKKRCAAQGSTMRAKAASKPTLFSSGLFAHSSSSVR